MTTTRAQAEALATFVRLIRKDWDHPGIVHAITAGIVAAGGNAVANFGNVARTSLSALLKSSSEIIAAGE